ncbi:MAG: hypothetical protein LC104_19435 [Bacteroidales bacterium]|nr:hypothetical protein [Bacteroidales bacterium]
MELFTDPQPVYNFEVEGLHSYAVGATGLLAHNSDPCNLGLGSEIADATKQAAVKPEAPRLVDRHTGIAPEQTSTSPAVPTVKGTHAPVADAVQPATAAVTQQPMLRRGLRPGEPDSGEVDPIV